MKVHLFHLSTTVVKAVNLDTVWVDVEVFAAQVSLVKFK